MENLYFFAIAITAFIFFIFIATKILIMLSSGPKNVAKKPKKNTKRIISDLKKTLEKNPLDYDAIYQLACIEDDLGEYDSALDKYEKLLNIGYFENIEALKICKRLEDRYYDLDDKLKSFKMSVKIMNLDNSNTEYLSKVANILTNEGYHLISVGLYSKLLYTRQNLDIDTLKLGAYSFYKIKDYKKSIVFLEELLKKYSKENRIEAIEVIKSLIFLYIYSDELGAAKSLIESVLIKEYQDPNFVYFIHKMYLFILYKLNDQQTFLKIFQDYLSLYKLSSPKLENVNLLFDYGFYSYFLMDLSLSLNCFKIVKGLNLNEYSTFNLESIMKYLDNMIKVTTQVNKESRNKNDSYEKYIDKSLIENWENAIKNWEASFVDIEAINQLVTIEPSLSIDQQTLSEINILSNSIDDDSMIKSKPVNKVDNIYELSFPEFKRLVQSIINKLNFVILQEYTDNISQDGSKTDEINYLAYPMKGSKKDTTLISFRRWRSDEIGELIIRDFLLMVKEAYAKKGVLIVPIELSGSAKSYVLHNDRITVYARTQLNNLLKDEKF